MDWKIHVILAIILYALLAQVLPQGPPERIALLLLVTVAGCLLPDIDSKSSLMSKIIEIILVFLIFIAIYYLTTSILFSLAGVLVFFILSAVARKYLMEGHRGFTHGFAALALFAAVIYALTQDLEIVVFAGAGYISHVLADKLL